jgi:hypothetical protein
LTLSIDRAFGADALGELEAGRKQKPAGRWASTAAKPNRTIMDVSLRGAFQRTETSDVPSWPMVQRSRNEWGGGMFLDKRR